MIKANMAVNVAIVAACLVTCADIVRKFTFSQPSSSNDRIRSMSLHQNEAIALDGVDWRRAPLTLVLAASNTCHFCAESAPFYRRLFSAAASTGVPVIMITQDSEPEATRKFFEGLDVHPGSVRKVSFGSVRIRGTPTLMAIDNYGKVAEIKVGTLRPDEEQRFIALASEPSLLRKESVSR